MKKNKLPKIPTDRFSDPSAQEQVRNGLAGFEKPAINGVNGIDMAFERGQVVTWIPRKARRYCYGLPLAYEPLSVEIVSGPRVTGDYRVKILTSHAKRILTRPTYDVDGKSLVVEV